MKPSTIVRETIGAMRASTRLVGTLFKGTSAVRGASTSTLGGLRWAVRLATLAVTILTLSVGGTASAQSVTPSTRIGAADLMSPAAADAFYGPSTVSTNGLGLSDRPREIKELARALRGDPDLIFDYVHNTIETEWAYGLRKGALGALVDKSGTAFDQAKLMVDLLRESGRTASYVVGSITLTGPQFYAWTGITNATAACQLLSSGAIPAVINGATIANCAYGGASVSTITLGHIWVRTVIGSGTFVFDPAYKPHFMYSGANLVSATGLATGQALSTATSGMDAGANGGVPFVRGLNGASLAALIDGYARAFLTYVNANWRSASLEEIVGGQTIARTEAPPGGFRQTTYGAETRSWVGDIPDQYRTTLRTQVLKFVGGVGPMQAIIDANLFADEIYGRKLIVKPNFIKRFPNPGGVNNNSTIIDLKLTDSAGNDVTTSPIGHYQQQGEDPQDREGQVILTVNHPYATNGGAYMDATVQKDVWMFVPLTIVAGWGNAGPGLTEAWGQRLDTNLGHTFLPGCDACEYSEFGTSLGDSRREQFAASWMVQASKASALHSTLAKSIFTLHHTLGVVTGDSVSHAQITNGFTTNPIYSYTLTESFDRIDVDDAFSLTSKQANADDRRAAIFAIAATRDALEGSVAGQIADLPDTTSTAVRFEWGNAPPAGEDLSNTYGGGLYGPRRFYQFDSANAGAAQNLVLVEGQQTISYTGYDNGSAEPLITSGEANVRRSRLAGAIGDYASAGFNVIASEDAFLGPGQRGGAQQLAQSNAQLYTHYWSSQRGGALVAVKSVNGEPVEIAHVAVGAYFTSKGGGGGGEPQQKAQYDPATAADVLRTRFADRSSAVGVSLDNGGVTYASPAGVSAGGGKFPYSLSANLIWIGGADTLNNFGPTVRTQPQAPWTTNWHNMLNVSSSGLEAMGETDPRAAAATIAAFIVQQDIYRAAFSAQRESAALLAGAWWVRQVAGNVVTANVGSSTRQFLHLVDGTWVSPSADPYATLTQIGSRQIGVETTCMDAGGPWYSPTRGWKYDNMAFQLKSGTGDIQTFNYWDAVNNLGGASCAKVHGFRLSNWYFPQGINVALTYAPDANGMPLLSEVSNSLGLKVRFHYDDASNLSGFDNNGLSVATIEREQYTGKLLSVTDATNAKTRFVTSVVDNRNLLNEVYDADDGATPSLRYVYDTMGRVKEGWDAVALQRTGHFYQFRIAPSARGEREDPDGYRFTKISGIVDQLTGVRSSRVIDEVGRTTSAEFDGRGRVAAQVQAWGDRIQYKFDTIGNVTEVKHVPKDWAGDPWWGQTPVWKFEYGDSRWPTAPTKVTQPDTAAITNSQPTVYEYNTQAVVWRITGPATYDAVANQSAQAVTTLDYDNYGRLTRATDPTGRVTVNGYGEGGQPVHCLTSTIVDPDGILHTGLKLTSHFECDSAGNVTAAIDPRNYRSTTGYDFMRRKIRTDGPAGTHIATAWDYDGNGNVRHEYSWAGNTDAPVGPVDTAQPWRVTTYDYSPSNKVVVTTDPAGDRTRTCYDNLDRPSVAVDPDGRAVRTNYNGAGDVTLLEKWFTANLSDAGCVVTSAADLPASPAINAGAKVSPNQYRRYIYNPGGLVDKEFDANGNATTFVYEGLGRVIETYGEDPDGAGPQIALYEVTQRDQRDQVINRRQRSGLWVQYDFDAAGRPKTVYQQSNGGTWVQGRQFAFDLAGRRATAGVYDCSGANCTISAYRSQVWQTYDGAGRMNQDVAYANGDSSLVLGLQYGYDASGNRTSIIWPANAGGDYWAMYQYDAAGRMTEARAGPLSMINTTPAVKAVYAYDAQSRRISVTRGASGAAATSAYQWENDGDLAQVSHAFTSGSVAAGVFTYATLPSGKIGSMSVGAAAFQWLPAAGYGRTYGVANPVNQIPSEAANAVTWKTLSLNGQVNNAGVMESASLDGSTTITSLAHDGVNRLMTATRAGMAAAYDYDADDRRAIKTVTQGAAVTTRTLWSGSDELAELDGAGTLQRRIIPGPGIDDKVASVEAATGVVRYFHTDRLGSVVATSDASGAVSDTYAYSPWGESNAAATGNPWRFTGRYLDAETGLYYYRARYYSPRLGQFLETDPIGTKDDPNLFMYVGLDPADKTDPSGLRCTLASNGRTYTCFVDEVGGQKASRVGRVEAAYARAVNRLMSHPNKDVKVTLQGRTFTVKAGALGRQLIGATVRTTTLRSNYAAANTAGGAMDVRQPNNEKILTVFDNHFDTDAQQGRGVAWTDNDLTQTFAHESLHMVPEEIAMSGVSNFNAVHGDAYNASARSALNNR